MTCPAVNDRSTEGKRDASGQSKKIPRRLMAWIIDQLAPAALQHTHTHTCARALSTHRQRRPSRATLEKSDAIHWYNLPAVKSWEKLVIFSSTHFSPCFSWRKKRCGIGSHSECTRPLKAGAKLLFFVGFLIIFFYVHILLSCRVRSLKKI